MATLFQSRPGQVIALADAEGDLGLPLTIDGISGTWFPSFRSILTGLSIGLDGNVQFTQTCKDLIYVYAFGDKISQMQVAGLAFSDDCSNSGGLSGIELVLAFYRINRAANRATPIQLQIGTSAAGRFRGYLTHFRADITKAEARISQFSFVFNVFPGT